MSDKVNNPILVIGGGVSGLAAAWHLAQAGQLVTILERGSDLGGKVLDINCKSIQGQCTHCGACAVYELVHKVKQHPLVDICFNNTVTELHEQDNHIEASVTSSDGQAVLTGCGAIIAAGLKPFPAEERHETGYGTIPRVLTALELEKKACQSGSFAFLGRSPRLAIIHCVGSRQGYCSRVCCLYGAKISRMLLEALPASSVDVYCLDRQRYRQEYVAEWPDTVRVTSAMPGRIYRNADGDCVIRAEDNVTAASIERRYDWVILCTGLVPDPAAEALGQKAGIDLDSYGFLNTSNATGYIRAAGGATAPLSFFECIESGIGAAGGILQVLVSK